MLRGVVSVVLDDEIKIRDIKILERESGLSIMMPNKKVADFFALLHVYVLIVAERKAKVKVRTGT